MNDKERIKQIEEEFLDLYLEHEMVRMEKRKQEIEDEAYLLAKVVNTQIVKKE